MWGADLVLEVHEGGGPGYCNVAVGVVRFRIADMLYPSMEGVIGASNVLEFGAANDCGVV